MSRTVLLTIENAEVLRAIAELKDRLESCLRTDEFSKGRALSYLENVQEIVIEFTTKIESGGET